MSFENEAELQEFLAIALQNLGHENEREVSTASGGGRIDILSDQYAIEVKPKLTRSALFQASGQIQSYQSSFPGRQMVIAGIAPSGESAYKSAKNTAQVIEKENGILTWFVDEMPEFQKAYSRPSYSQPSESFNFFEFDSFAGKVAIAAFFLFVVSVASVNTRSGSPTAPKVTQSQPREATVIVRANIRKTPSTADDSNIVEQAEPGAVLKLTGNKTINQYAEWAEVESTTGDRAWIAAPAVTPK